MRRLPLRYYPILALVIVQSALSMNLHSRMAAATEAADNEPARPLNLLIIHTDEHNFRTLGCYRKLMKPEQALMWGDAVVETPNIDWIAEHGAICTSFYATTPVCSPSRAAFMSGRYPQHTPVTTNNIPLDGGIVTFAELLRQQGYATGYAGKWHLDGVGKPQWAPQRKFGFDDNRYMFNRGHWKQLEVTAKGSCVKSQQNGKPSYAVAGADEDSFTTDFLADRTVEFIAAHKEQPFCYMVSIPDPHGPDTVRPPYDTMFQHQVYRQPRTFAVSAEAVPEWGSPVGGFQGMASYYGMVKCIDDNVGKILATLRRESLLEETIVLFTADHGDLRGEHHRQNKGVPYEASAKVPFVIYAPRKIQPGTVVNEALGCVDFLPTILSLLDCRTAGEEQGRDASQLLMTGQPPANWNDATVIRSTSAGKRWIGIVSDRFKLIYSPTDDPWLFDLQSDPDELNNVFRDPTHRLTVRELSRALVAYAQKYEDPYVDQPQVRADLQWAVTGTGPYTSSPARKSTARKRSKQKNIGQNRNRQEKKS